MSVVEQLESRFLPLLKEAAAELQREFPRFQITTWSLPVGSLTGFQGHDLGIDCLLPDAPPEQSDNICLIIGVMHITTAPEIFDAAVCWGADSRGGGGDLELDLLPQPVPWGADALSHIDVVLPQLVAALRSALNRGRPLQFPQMS